MRVRVCENQNTDVRLDDVSVVRVPFFIVSAPETQLCDLIGDAMSSLTSDDLKL